MIQNYPSSEEGSPTIKSLRFGKTNGDAEILARTEKEIGYPCIVKPNNPSSSMGVTVAQNVHQLREGIVKAFRHDDYIVVEENIQSKNEGQSTC